MRQLLTVHLPTVCPFEEFLDNFDSTPGGHDPYQLITSPQQRFNARLLRQRWSGGKVSTIIFDRCLVGLDAPLGVGLDMVH